MDSITRLIHEELVFNFAKLVKIWRHFVLLVSPEDTYFKVNVYQPVGLGIMRIVNVNYLF